MELWVHPVNRRNKSASLELEGWSTRPRRKKGAKFHYSGLRRYTIGLLKRLRGAGLMTH